jgi:hypothetical protein
VALSLAWSQKVAMGSSEAVEWWWTRVVSRWCGVWPTRDVSHRPCVGVALGACCAHCPMVYHATSVCMLW